MKKKASIFSVTLFLSASHGLWGMGLCASSRGSRATLAKIARAILILLHRHWEYLRSLLVFLSNILQWAPWNTVFSRSHLESYLRGLYRIQKPLVLHFYTSFQLYCITLWWSSKTGRNLRKPLFLIAAAINIQSSFQRAKTVPYRKSKICSLQKSIRKKNFWHGQKNDELDRKQRGGLMEQKTGNLYAKRHLRVN